MALFVLDYLVLEVFAEELEEESIDSYVLEENGSPLEEEVSNVVERSCNPEVEFEEYDLLMNEDYSVEYDVEVKDEFEEMPLIGREDYIALQDLDPDEQIVVFWQKYIARLPEEVWFTRGV